MHPVDALQEVARHRVLTADLSVLLSIGALPEQAGHNETFVDVHSRTRLIQNLHASHPPWLISDHIQ